jgi:hypothetical protein
MSLDAAIVASAGSSHASCSPSLVVGVAASHNRSFVVCFDSPATKCNRWLRRC